MFKRLLALMLFVPLIFISGCLDAESGVSLNKDLSGKASFKMAMDLAPMMDQLMKTMEAQAGQPAPPGMMDMIKSQMAQKLGAGIFDVTGMKAKLPTGVTLADSSQKIEDLRVTAAFTFAFTNINQLPLIEMPPSSAAVGAPAAGEKPAKMFDFEIKDDGSAISISTKAPEKPSAEDEKKKAEAMATAKDAMSQLDALGLRDMLKIAKVKVVMRFDIPQTVVEHNATRTEGQSYFWETKLDSLEKLDIDSIDKAIVPPTMKLKFKK